MENNQVVEQQDKKAMVKKVLTIVGNVVFYAVIIALFLFSLMNINAGNGKKSFPNLFGKGMLSVESSSMERNEGGYHPAEWDDYKIGEIKKGDLVYDNVFKQKNFSKLKIGDVITFYDINLDALNTHRIVYIGDDYVITQGDYIITQSTSDTYYYDTTNTDTSKNYELTSNPNYAQVVDVKNIKGVVTGVKSGAGKVLDNIRSNWLFYFVIPVAVILIAEIFFVFKNFMDLKREKNSEALGDEKAAMMAELEAEKERMRQELLAELKAQQAAAPEEAPQEEPKEEVTEEPSVEAEGVAPQEEAPAEEPKAEEATEEVAEETAAIDEEENKSEE